MKNLIVAVGIGLVVGFFLWIGEGILLYRYDWWPWLIGGVVGFTVLIGSSRGALSPPVREEK